MNDIYEKIKPHFGMIERHLGDGGGLTGLCRKLGVTRRELIRCAQEHAELRELLRQGRAEVAERIEAALVRRATGYEEESGKQVPPDVRAAVFWLKNRRPGRWNEAGGKTAAAPPEIKLSPEEEDL